MTHDELIAETGMALCENALGGKRCPCREAGTFACADEYPGQQARAAIRVIAPVVLDEATNLADGHLPLGYMSERERSYCNEHGEEIAHAIRALKTRYEQ